MTRLRQGELGQSLVEFALIFPILILLLVALFDIGRLVFAYNDITNSAREGTRVGIVDQTTGNIQSDVIAQSTSLSLTAGQIDVKYCKADGTSCSTTKPTNLDALVQVEVTYSWRAITPIVGTIIGPITVKSVSRMPIERVYP